MVVQVSLGGKLGLTTRLFALVRSLSCVKAHVGFEIAFFVKCFQTVFNWAHEVPIALMLFQMNLKTLGSAVGLSTLLVRTHVAALLRMSLKVIF